MHDLLYSKIVPTTERTDPADAQTPSHRLLVRAGFVRALTSGVYLYAHLGLRVLRKIENVVREEMNRAGAVEVLLPILQPRALWEETGRWDVYRESRTFFTTRDRREQDLALAPTAEEAITWLVREHVRSWRQLPLNLYQISPKFRDELRPRFGVVRGREFLMKDSYSFDRDEAGMGRCFLEMRDAYQRIFTRLGLNFRMVEADSGAIGGGKSAEFMILADTGEDTIVSCPEPDCGYGANQEKAVSRFARNDATLAPAPARLEDTPGMRSVAELSAGFGLPAARMVKTILYVADGSPVAVCIRGDQEINEVKLGNRLGAKRLELADAETVRRVTGADVGFAGPIGLRDCRILFDVTVEGIRNFLCGGNATDKHWLDVNLGRDLPAPGAFDDLRRAEVGDGCAACGRGVLGITRGIEAGHIFQLGTRYSEAMHAVYADESGVDRPMFMGCYGIGISRLLAARIEQGGFDDKGIIWPEIIAPYRVAILPTSPAELPVARALYERLLPTGEVILDDRDERAGVKFNDADLVGYPFQVIVGRKAKEGRVEIKRRATGERVDVTLDEAPAWLSRA